MHRTICNIGCILWLTLGSACILDGATTAPAPLDCRSTNTCDPEAWVFEFEGPPLFGGGQIPGLNNIWPIRFKNTLLPSALGGTQQLITRAEYVVPRDEAPDFDVVFEGGAERVTSTATSVTFRTTEVGRAEMVVEQRGLRGPAAFTYDIEVAAVQSVGVRVLPMGDRDTTPAAALADTPFWINLEPRSAADDFLVDQDMSVSLKVSKRPVRRTPSWHVFEVPGLPVGSHSLVVHTGSGQRFEATIDVVEEGAQLVLFDGHGANPATTELTGTVKFCVGAKTDKRYLSVADASFSTTDPELTIAPLMAEPGTRYEGYNAPWCRRVSRQSPGLSDLRVGVAKLSKVVNLSFK